MRIRPADSSEVTAIRELVQLAYGHYIERIGARPKPMDWDYAERVGRGVVSVAEEDGDVVGLIVLIPEPGHLLVENVAVAPARQGEGIGRALLAFAEEQAREAGTPVLRLFTHVKMTENQALYAQLGYVETARDGEGHFKRIFFEKRL